MRKIQPQKIFLAILLFLINIGIQSQNITEEKYLLTNTANTLGVSSISILDPYLAPIQYDGQNLQFNSESFRFLKADNLNFSQQKTFNIEAGIASNPSSTSSMLYYGLNYSYGIHYHYRPLSKLTIMAGANWDGDIAFKYLARNSNNPVSTDVSTNLNVSGIASYKFNLLKRNAMLQLSVQSPVLGCMFVPQISSSYYEMFLLGNMGDAIHFSSIHNKQGINSKLLFHFPFNKSNWHLGISYKGLKYSANDVVYKQENFSILIGSSFDIIKFSGGKSKVPSNFINIYE